MAKKSKAQRAKASARRAEKRELAQKLEQQEIVEPEPVPEKKSKIPFIGKKSEPQETAEEKRVREREERAKEKEKALKKKNRFSFFKEVRSEMKRVTWPSRQDVTQWSLVVVGALLFFGVFVLVLDNFIVTPILYGISNLGSLIGN